MQAAAFGGDRLTLFNDVFNTVRDNYANSSESAFLAVDDAAALQASAGARAIKKGLAFGSKESMNAHARGC